MTTLSFSFKTEQTGELEIPLFYFTTARYEEGTAITLPAFTGEHELPYEFPEYYETKGLDTIPIHAFFENCPQFEEENYTTISGTISFYTINKEFIGTTSFSFFSDCGGATGFNYLNMPYLKIAYTSITGELWPYEVILF